MRDPSLGAFARVDEGERQGRVFGLPEISYIAIGPSVNVAQNVGKITMQLTSSLDDSVVKENTFDDGVDAGFEELQVSSSGSGIVARREGEEPRGRGLGGG